MSAAFGSRIWMTARTNMRPAVECEEPEAEPEEGAGDSQVLAADEGARQVAQVRLVGRLEPVDLRDDVQDGCHDEQDAEQAERLWILIRVADDLDAQAPRRGPPRTAAR